MTELHFRPIDGRLNEILDELMSTGEVASHSSLSNVFHLVSEEIIVNIIHFAYSVKADAYLTLYIRDENEAVSIEFRDGGKPFNPLEREHLDISLPSLQPNIGGLDICLVCEMMDEVCYSYKNMENRLIVIKRY